RRTSSRQSTSTLRHAVPLLAFLCDERERSHFIRRRVYASGGSKVRARKRARDFTLSVGPKSCFARRLGCGTAIVQAVRRDSTQRKRPSAPGRGHRSLCVQLVVVSAPS